MTDLAGNHTTFSAAAALCLALTPLQAFAAKPPTLVSGKIISQVIHVGVLPVAPKVSLDLRGETERVYFYWTGPGNQFFDDNFFASEPNGRSIFDGAGISETFSPYAPAGTWTLTTVYVCASNSCNEYTGPTLTPLFPTLTLTVVNPHSDTSPPTINSAVITTPTVVASGKARIEVDLNIQDDLSGATSASVTFSNSSRDTITVGGALSYAVKSAAPYLLTSYCRCQALIGTYTATKISLMDAAGNQVVITDADTISNLFEGQTTLNITD